MNPAEIEQYFFRPTPRTSAQHEASRRQSSESFREVEPRAVASYRMSLASVLPSRTQAILDSGQIVFHTVGDTGGVNGLGAQENVADHMTRQIQDSTLPDQPSFFYHLSDVVYYNGKNDAYHDQFYHPYQDYPAPIFAIPGNHDGNTIEAGNSLLPFMKHFDRPGSWPF